MTYQNAQQARQDLWLFGAHMFSEALVQRLSMDDVLSRGRFCKFDTDDLLGEAAMNNSLFEPPVSQDVSS